MDEYPVERAENTWEEEMKRVVENKMGDTNGDNFKRKILRR